MYFVFIHLIYTSFTYFISILFRIIQFFYNSFFFLFLSSKYDDLLVSKWILEFPFDSRACVADGDPGDSGCTLTQLNKVTIGVGWGGGSIT